jgi:rhodanese-related sulfurtransferase
MVRQLGLKQKNAPIIVYDANQGSQASAVAKELISEGYFNVKVLNGGFDAWQSERFEAVDGKLATKANYVPKPRPGEINQEEFRKYAETLPANVMIIDVRSVDEGNAGMLKSARLIPAEDLKERSIEIPKDRLIVLYCNTGVIAEMAYHTLKELGYTKVKFLNAQMAFEKNGSYKISEN